MTPEAVFPISRPVSVADLIRDVRRDMEIKTTAEERRALADFLGIPEVKAVSAKMTLRAEPGRRFVLDGRIKARLVQTCVVSLEPVDEAIDAQVRLVFEDAPVQAADDDGDASDEDLPEPVVGGVIDAGAVLCEQVALEMSPYPRKPGAEALELPGKGQGNPRESGREDHPFAALAKLRDAKE